MPRRSSLARFILWLHQNAHREGRVTNWYEGAEVFLAALKGGYDTDPQWSAEAQAGTELHAGSPTSPLAHRVAHYARGRLADLPLILRHIDEVGYTALIVRALLQEPRAHTQPHFYWVLKAAPLGSDEHAVYLDLRTAIERASPSARHIALLLVAGLGVQEISTLLKTNGARRVAKAMNELAAMLEGRQTS